MALDQQQSETQPDETSPFTRPAFVVAAVVVLLIVVVGAVVVVRVATGDQPGTQPPPSGAPQSPTASVPRSPTDPAASVCGLPAGDAAPLTLAPAASWEFQGTTAYPTSPEFGPIETAPEGYRYCFQNSQAGAVMMAANAFAQGSDPEVGDRWAQYVLADGRYKDQLVDELGTTKGAEGTRVKIAGFRVLAYDERSARIDLGTQVSSQNQTLTASCVYELVWQDGDWKISTDVERPLDIATIPDLTGYVPWGA